MATQALVDSWRAEADATYRQACRDFDEETARRWRRHRAPGISVVVTSCQGRQRIERCLRSLTQQTLAPELFEVIVVLHGPPDGTRRLISQIQRDHPALTLRVVQRNVVGASRARNAGIAAARRDYTTFIDDGDHVSATFLEVMLANAGRHRVSVAALVDVRDIDGARAAELVDFRRATTVNPAKVVATDLAKAMPYDVDLAVGEDLLFWTRVAVQGHAEFRACQPPDGALYYRTPAPDSSSGSAVSFDLAVAQRCEVIARLERLMPGADRGGGDGPHLLRERIAEQAMLIGDYLQKNPADHSHVVTLLDQYPIFHMPYARMNSALPRGLAIAYAFPPYADTSAVVSAKRIRARGRVVDVIYNAMDRIRETDSTLRRISGPFVCDEAALSTPSYFSDWASMEKFCVEGMDVIRGWEAAKGRYGFVYSRAQFAASHFLAAAYKLSNPSAIWTAEFSDPLARDIFNKERGTPVVHSAFLNGLSQGLRGMDLTLPRSRNCFVWAEELAYLLADELIFTNQNQMEYMLGYCSNPQAVARAREKAVITPHATLPREFYAMVDHDYPLEEAVTHLAYFGNFYATRGLNDVLAAVARTDPSTRAQLRVHVFTAKPHELEHRVAELGIAGSVRVGPYVRYLEFLNLTTKFDCLIVNDAITDQEHPTNPYLPSKWADYRGSGTPVWGLVEAGSPLSMQPLDFTSPVGDVPAAAQVLSRIVQLSVGCTAPR